MNDDRLDTLADRLRAARRAARRDDDPDWGNVPRMGHTQKDRYVVVDDDDENDDEQDIPPEAYDIVYEQDGDSDPKTMDELIGELPMDDDGTIDYRACGFNFGPAGGVAHPDAEPDSGDSGGDNESDE